jgi:hypothetical protein
MENAPLPAGAPPVAFRAQAVRPLLRVIEIHASRIARRRETPAAAATATWRIADALGAGGLSPPWRQHLGDWIAAELERRTAAERAKLVPEARL